MNDTHDVISAFLDDEPFDSSRLVEALSDPAGRDLLIDLIALRHLARTERHETLALPDRATRRSSLRALVGIAAIVVALVGGYFIGQRQSQFEASAPPPPATRVVQAPAAWQDVPPGTMP